MNDIMNATFGNLVDEAVGVPLAEDRYNYCEE